jgi:predicted outer membrane protein
MRDPKEIKLKIIEAGHQAVEQLIKVAKEDIIKPDDDDELSADRLKNAAATKKLAIFDAFEILNRIESEREGIEMLEKGINRTDTKQGFAERRSISGR